MTSSPKTRACLLLVLTLCSITVAQEKKAATSAKLTEAQIDQLVAPVALYPDPLIAQVLMAATYPLEIVQADRWAQANAKMKSDQVTAELEKKTWDPSVKSLIAVPDVLKQMSERLDWTQKLGDAVLGQRADVMNAVQRLRGKAKDSGNLKTTKEQEVIVAPNESAETKVIYKEVIRIEPAKPEVIYVPTYNPTVVYGAWPYPAYPPAYYYPPGYVFGAAAMGFAIGSAIHHGCWGYAWGGCSWGRGDIDIDINRNRTVNNNIDRRKYERSGQNRKGNNNSWRHNPDHRHGVRYRDSNTAKKYGRDNRARTSSTRDKFRGHSSSTRNGSRLGSSGNRSGSNRRPSGSSSTRNRSSSSMNRGRSSTRSSAFGGSGSRHSTSRSGMRGSSSRHGGGSRHHSGSRGGRSRGGGRGRR